MPKTFALEMLTLQAGRELPFASSEFDLKTYLSRKASQYKSTSHGITCRSMRLSSLRSVVCAGHGTLFGS